MLTFAHPTDDSGQWSNSKIYREKKKKTLEQTREEIKTNIKHKQKKKGELTFCPLNTQPRSKDDRKTHSHFFLSSTNKQKRGN